MTADQEQGYSKEPRFPFIQRDDVALQVVRIAVVGVEEETLTLGIRSDRIRTHTFRVHTHTIAWSKGEIIVIRFFDMDRSCCSIPDCHLEDSITNLSRYIPDKSGLSSIMYISRSVLV